MRRYQMFVIGVITLGMAAGAESQLVFPDGSQQDIAAAEYTRIVVVNADGSATENGTALLAAVSDVTTAAADNPFLIQLEPGNYDLGASALSMKEYVSVHGSGLGSTIVTSSGATTISLNDNATLQFLTAQNTGSNAVALRASGVSVSVFRIAAVSLGSTGDNAAVSIESGAGVNITNSTISADASNSGDNIGLLVTGTGSLANARSTSITASGGSTTNIGLEVGTAAIAQLGFVQIATGGTATGVMVAGGGVASLFACAVVSTGSTALANAGTVSAATTLFDGTRGGGGSTAYAHCIHGSFAPITDTFTSVP